MKLLNNFLLVIFTRNLKPLVKSLCWTKNLGKKKIEQSPQFMEVILYKKKIWDLSSENSIIWNKPRTKNKKKHLQRMYGQNDYAQTDSRKK